MSDIYPIAVPKWGIEMVEGTIVTWNKAIGDAISKGDGVFEMESDKIVNDWESPVDGILRRRIVEEGETETVFRNPQHAYTRQLIASSPDIDSALAQRKTP